MKPSSGRCGDAMPMVRREPCASTSIRSPISCTARPMDEILRAHVDASLDLIEDLMRRGREIKVALAVDVIREWQRDCAAAINQWSGGSKAHWLARAYSGAFLVRATDGGVVVEASAAEIVDRILDVLAQARTSLSGIDSLPTAGAAAPSPRRFEFVHNP